MGFLKRLFGGTPQPREQLMHLRVMTFSEQRPDAALDIVGEASYQVPLDKLGGLRDERGPAVGSQSAIVAPEPANKFDRNAIAVYLRDNDGSMWKVGYLSRENAVAYGPVFRSLAPVVIGCPATLKGGWNRGGDRGTIGVVLNLGSPAELAAEIWLDTHPAALEHRWRGKLVAFTGDSGYAVSGVRLDRMGQQYLAQRAGCQTWPRVTKSVQVCVASQPEDETGNLRKAEGYGLELVREADFWVDLGFQLTPA